MIASTSAVLPSLKWIVLLVILVTYGRSSMPGGNLKFIGFVLYDVTTLFAPYFIHCIEMSSAEYLPPTINKRWPLYSFASRKSCEWIICPLKVSIPGNVGLFGTLNIPVATMTCVKVSSYVWRALRSSAVTVKLSVALLYLTWRTTVFHLMNRFKSVLFFLVNRPEIFQVGLLLLYTRYIALYCTVCFL